MTNVFTINANTIDKVKNIYETTAHPNKNEDISPEVKYKSFIGHSVQEARIGIAIQEYIENSFPSLSQCFLSRSNLLVGDNIADQILNALMETRLHIVVFSPTSINRHWLHLEAGTALLRRVPIVGVTHSGLTPSELPDPYRTFLAAEIDTLQGVERLCRTLSERAEVPPPSEQIIRRFFGKLQKARRDCVE